MLVIFRSKNVKQGQKLELACWYTCWIIRKPIRDNPKIFTKSKKNVFKSEKIFQIVMFFWKEFIKSEKLLQILIKLLNPQISFCKSQTNLQIQELSLNPEKYFANPKKYFVTCYLRQQSASVRVCFSHFALSKMAEERVWVMLCMIRVKL